MAKFSLLGPMCNRHLIVKVFLAVTGLLTCTASALAAGGKVLPPDATPKGYSLWDMAEETAVYNTGEPGTTEPVPDVPFLVLIDDATVKPGTMLYVPVFNWNDGSQLLVSPFPKDLRDQKEDADYLLDTADAYADAEITAFIVQVDGKTTILSADYAVGVKTPPLPDGGGTHYIVSAAFITPLAPGDHTVGIGGIIGGEPVVFVSYTVTVGAAEARSFRRMRHPRDIPSRTWRRKPPSTTPGKGPG